MRRFLLSFLLATALVNVFWFSPSAAQERRGSISGRATDINHDPLVGARVEVQPLGRTTTTDAQGLFTVSDLAPDKYTVAISYVGFKTYSGEVTVTSGAVANGRST